MSKKFKLVYESEGMLKGSYSGIPADSDEELIERAVLEGSKPVPPVPGPTPEPEVDNEKSYEEARACLLSIQDAYIEERAIELKVDKTFNFKDCSFDYIHELFTSIDEEFLKFMLDCLDSEALKLDFNIFMSLMAGRSSENSFTYFDLYYNTGGLSHEASCSVSCEIDAETGDTRMVTIFPNENFTGSLRIVFDGSKL